MVKSTNKSREYIVYESQIRRIEFQLSRIIRGFQQHENLLQKRDLFGEEIYYIGFREDIYLNILGYLESLHASMCKSQA